MVVIESLGLISNRGQRLKVLGDCNENNALATFSALSSANANYISNTERMLCSNFSSCSD